jgi:hypothetical protein
MGCDIIYDIAWAAGFLDGEGCFQLRRLSKKKMNWGPEMEAAQTCPEPLEKLRTLFGGRVHELKRITTKHRRVWRWDMNGAEAIRDALTAMLPFLTVKKKQAGLVLAYIEMMQIGRSGGGHLTEEQRKAREKIANMLLVERNSIGR